MAAIKFTIPQNIFIIVKQFRSCLENRGRCRGIFFTTEGTEKENGKGTEGEKTGMQDWSAGWDEDGYTTFFVHRATTR